MTFAQMAEIGQYRMGYLMKTMPIKYSPSSQEIGISVFSNDRFSTDVTLMVDNSRKEIFVKNFIQAKLKYNEWKKTAIENNVEEIVKSLDIEPVEYNVSFSRGNDLYLDQHCLTGFKFIGTKGKYILIYSNLMDLQHYSNRFIKSEGFMIAFESEEEIDRFLLWTNPQVIESEYKKVKDKSDLFK